MKVIIAIDSFKGCLASIEAGEAAAAGVRAAWPGVRALALPVSDGGEGMLDAFAAALKCDIVTARVRDPLARPVMARYGITPDGATAVIEVAQACGLGLLADGERDPEAATSFGAGQLIADTLRRGCTRLIVGLGGTATSDAGRGMLQALGLELGQGADGKARPTLDGRGIDITVAVDVANPLCGPDGAARVFAPQKGASPEAVSRIERQIECFARATATRLGRDCSGMPGAGAGGGMGFALAAYLGASLRPGADLLLDLLGFDRLLDGCSLVITGEGSADRQTLMGKLPLAVMLRARRHGVPAVLLAGRVSARARLLGAGFRAVECVNPDDSPPHECMRPDVARRRIAATAARLKF